MADFPFAEVTRKAAIMSSQGMDVYQKFTCTGCGHRVVSRTPNIFIANPICPRCGAENDAGRRGCNYEVGHVAARRA